MLLSEPWICLKTIASAPFPLERLVVLLCTLTKRVHFLIIGPPMSDGPVRIVVSVAVVLRLPRRRPVTAGVSLAHSALRPHCAGSTALERSRQRGSWRSAAWRAEPRDSTRGETLQCWNLSRILTVYPCRLPFGALPWLWTSWSKSISVS